MFKKITIEEAGKFSIQSRLNQYLVNPYWLAYNGYSEKFGKELLLYDRDFLFKNDFPYISLPKNKELWSAAIMVGVTEENIVDIKKEGITLRYEKLFGTEYQYLTNDFVELKDHRFRKAVHRFESKYKFKIKTDYPKKKILDFLAEWELQQKEKNFIFEMGKDFERFCLDQYKKIGGKRLFIEIDGKLVAYGLFMKLNKDYWVGIHRKVNYGYEGLSRFLLHQEALIFKDIPYFTLGSGAQDKGIEDYKKSLKPFKEEKHFYIITDEKDKEVK